MPYLSEFLTVAVVHLFAVASPGPDFVMISRNILHSRKAGLFSAIGLALGILVHVTYSLVGIGLVISQSILLFSILKFLGAGYLIYLGYKSLRSRPKFSVRNEQEQQNVLGAIAAIRIGFLTNVLNPKVTLFFLALFTQVISPDTPKVVQALYGLEMSTMTFVWFALVATLLSHRKVKERFSFMQHHLQRAFGAVLIALGIKVALSSSK
ncbi:MAG: LysE family transporter [Candidatus Doudnabacteria bacterium]|nr:LysE family transporter [Candidatus Doudnabacteria bacterium]